jgi:hypothetical protein
MSSISSSHRILLVLHYRPEHLRFSLHFYFNNLFIIKYKSNFGTRVLMIGGSVLSLRASIQSEIQARDLSLTKSPNRSKILGAKSVFATFPVVRDPPNPTNCFSSPALIAPPKDPKVLAKGEARGSYQPLTILPFLSLQILQPHQSC